MYKGVQYTNTQSSTWNLKLGTWNLKLETWNLEPGTRNLELGTNIKTKALSINNKNPFTGPLHQVIFPHKTLSFLRIIQNLL